jgi:hypothetical protein
MLFPNIWTLATALWNSKDANKEFPEIVDGYFDIGCFGVLVRLYVLCLRPDYA